MQAAIAVHLRIGSEGLHHGLLESLCMVSMVNDHVTVGQDLLHVAVGLHIAGHQIAPVVTAHRAGRVPVLLGMDEDGVVQGLVHIQNGGQQLVFDFHQTHGLVGGLFVFRRNDGHRVPHKAQLPVQNQPVIGGGLRVGLARDGKAGFGHVLPGIDGHHAGDFQGDGGVDLLHQGAGMGAAQQFDHQGVPGDDVVGVDRLAQQKLHRVLFAHGMADILVIFSCHCALLSPFCCPDRRGCPAAGPRNRSSGRGCPPDTPGSRRRWGRDFPAAGRWCS